MQIQPYEKAKAWNVDSSDELLRSRDGNVLLPMEYGVLELTGHYRRVAFQIWRRDETYYSVDGTIHHESSFALTDNDVSDVHLDSDGYDSRCNSCWFGHGHTQGLHAVRVLAAKAKKQDKSANFGEVQTI